MNISENYTYCHRVPSRGTMMETEQEGQLRKVDTFVSGHGGAEAASRTFKSKHREIDTLMTKCENYIDYEQHDDAKSLRSQKRV